MDYFDLLTEKVELIAKVRGYSGHKILMHKKDEKYCAFVKENGHFEHLISLSSLHPKFDSLLTNSTTKLN